MKKKYYLGILLFLFFLSSFSQEEMDKRAARNPFYSTRLNNSFTTKSLPKKSLQFDLEHRFGKVNNGISDVFGIYSTANLRLGLAYALTDRITLMTGLTKTYMMADFGINTKILEQTRSNYMPISLSYLAFVNIENRNSDYYTKYIQKLFYYNQLSVSRKFSRLLTLQLSLNYSHFNLVDSAFYNEIKHNNLGLSFSGRMRLSPTTILLFEYDANLTAMQNRPSGDTWYGKPNLGVGVEFATAGHSFQIFLSNYQGINPARNMVYNNYDMWKGDFVISFNLVRIWDFN